ncbi:hypothetical protein [Paenibacillus sp. NAIST15-1]|uniref:hypothetical protein n=1 Tax=Paenibacillus sp. NAIST15-1 TaxID=1605994 RepID=UPI00086D7A40|nr:hypothetical protein [Paenibacillus sp. NAIST15-1]GAV16089.1 hypothetical protein PBN151_6074 [Paenibacillus sp. NAIST15-1]
MNFASFNSGQVPTTFGSTKPKGVSGTFDFVTNTGSTTLNFPNPASIIYVSRSPDSSTVKGVCTTDSGETLNLDTPFGGKYYVTPSVPANSIQCQMTTTGKNDAKYVVHSYESAGKKENLNVQPTAKAPVTPIKPDTKPGSMGFGYKSYYFPSRDNYRVDYWGYDKSAETLHIEFTSSSGTHYTKSYKLADGIDILYLTCNGVYDITLRDASGAVKHTIPSIRTDKISSPACSSGIENKVRNDLNAGLSVSGCGPEEEKKATMYWDQDGSSSYEIWKDGQKIGETSNTHYQVEDPKGSYTIIGGGGKESDVNVPADITSGTNALNEVAKAICECINDLQPVLSEIRDNTADAVVQLQIANGNLNHIGNVLEDINRHLTPTVDVQRPSVHIPSLNDFRPDYLPNGTYKDNNIYFRPNGVEPSPPSFPQAPEPTKEWKDANGNVVRQQGEMTKDPLLKQDSVLKQDPVPAKQPEMKQDKPLQQDSVLKQDPIPIRQPEMKRDAPMVQDTKQYQVRWKSP